MDVSSPWKDHSKHIFVLTAAGKPIFSRHGAEGDATAIMTVISAVVGRTLDTADPIKVINAGNSLFVFSLRGPFVLVAVSRTGETVHALSEQLRAIHSTIIMTLTSRIETRLRERPGLDVRQSLGGPGTRSQFLNVVRNSNRYPSLWLDAVPILTLPAGVKSKITSILSSASQRTAGAGAAGGEGLVYALLLAGTTVVAWAQTRNKDYSLKPHDAFLLSNLVQSSAAMRMADSWIPVCLPSLDDGGFLHAFISYLGAVNVPMSMTARTASTASTGSGMEGGGGSGANRGALPRASMPPSLSSAGAAGAAGGGGGAGARPAASLVQQQQQQQAIGQARMPAVSSPATAGPSFKPGSLSAAEGSSPVPSALSSAASPAPSPKDKDDDRGISSVRERGETAYSDDDEDDDGDDEEHVHSPGRKGSHNNNNSAKKSGLGLRAIDPLVTEPPAAAAIASSAKDKQEQEQEQQSAMESEIDAALNNYGNGNGNGGNDEDDDDDDDSVAEPPSASAAAGSGPSSSSLSFPALASPRHRPSVSLVTGTTAGRTSRSASTAFGASIDKALEDEDNDEKDGAAGGGLLLEEAEEQAVASHSALPSAVSAATASPPAKGAGATDAAAAASSSALPPSDSLQSSLDRAGGESEEGEQRDEEEGDADVGLRGQDDDEEEEASPAKAASLPTSPVLSQAPSAGGDASPAAPHAATATTTATTTTAAASASATVKSGSAPLITAAAKAPSAAAAAAAASAVHIAQEPPGVFLVLVSSESAGGHVEALAARKQAMAAQLHESQSIAYVMRALAAAHVGGPGMTGPSGSGGVGGAGGPAGWLLSAAGAAFSTSGSGPGGSSFVGPGIGGGVGDFLPSAYGIQGLLHFIYVWKPWRQYTMSRFASCLGEYSQRKALLRAYQILYDRLLATTPPLRHAVSTFGGWEGVIGHLAGIHTTNALVLCAFDPTITADKVPVLTEKLAKAVKKDHDKLLLPNPGVL